jgi:hypothetical protein
MLTRIFGQINSATSTLVILYTIVFAAGYIYIDPVQSFLLTTAAGSFMIHPIAGWILFICGLLLLVLAYQRLFQMQYKLVKQHALVSFMFVPLQFLVAQHHPLEGVILSACMFGLLYLWFDAFTGDKLLSNALNTGFLLGIGSLFNPVFTLLLPFTVLVYIIYGRLSGRTLIIPSIGFITVWLYAFAFDYLFADSTFVWNNFLNQFKVASAGWQDQLSMLIFFGLLLVLGLVEFITTLNRANVFKRLTFLALVSLIAMAVLVYPTGLFPLVVIVPVVSLVFVNYLQYIKRTWIKELAMWIVLAVFILLQQNLI